MAKVTKPSEPLKNGKWEIYAQRLAAGDEQKPAYDKAGYKYTAGAASKLANNKPVAERVQFLKEKSAGESGVDLTYVISNLKKVVERCLCAEPVYRRDIDGDYDAPDADITSGEWQFNAAGANKALELLGKHVGAFKADNDQTKPDLGNAVIVQYPINNRD
jgi:phage terminase small subunit